ncbi:hypothetical protein GCM10011375_22250 [Hymenobacter qilianensis]|uniref:Uncharacterized protein n=1 Tax=Hymenobacter qilianensis TaxID=1385715 RepID=A0ACB5PS98_9BACT|nr:hypothetical protein GCM10011375_22250 [Hymenobacter qilianensis]
MIYSPLDKAIYLALIRSEKADANYQSGFGKLFLHQYAKAERAGLHPGAQIERMIRIQSVKENKLAFLPDFPSRF